MTTENEFTEQEAIELKAVEAQASELAATEEVPTDFSGYTKQDFVDLLEALMPYLKDGDISTTDIRKVDVVIKEVKPLFDQIKAIDKQQALSRFITDNGAEEGFEFHADANTQRFEKLFKEVRDIRSKHFQNFEKSKEQNFTLKTTLLQRLRELAESEDSNDKKQLVELRKIQEEWKIAGNVASPHNSTLWATYHALNDRFYDKRSIYFELLELDRKRNLQRKIELCEKVEKLVVTLESTPVSSAVIDDVNATFEEYKQVGQAPREAQEIVWQRFKAAIDTIYDKRRSQLEVQKGLSEENYKLKAEIAALVEPFATFHTDTITEWGERTKALLALQDQWNNVKGSLPRDRGRELNRQFWHNTKAFYQNKNDFFKALEAKRAENLKAKTDLCEKVEQFLSDNDDSPTATQQIIKLQQEWRTIGHVPEKWRDKIFDRFKKACDQHFERKRSKNQETDREFENNLQQKLEICQTIETAATAGNGTMEQLNSFKSQWSTVGFVPKKDMPSIHKRYIDAVNNYVRSMGKLSDTEKDQMVLEHEVASARKDRQSGSNQHLQMKESDVRRRIQNFENDIALWRNNLEFFAKSKNTDKLRADFEKKIEKAEADLDVLKTQLRTIREA